MTRARPPLADTTLLARHIAAVPDLQRLYACSEEFAAVTPDLVTAILDEAARFAAGYLDDLNAAGERDGPRLAEGRVQLSALHRTAFSAFAGAGWLSLDLPVSAGGQGLPLLLAIAVQDIFDRSCAAFGMLGVSTRSAVKLIDRWASEPVRQQWLPQLATGEWTATICISEAEAGSDAARIRTTAVARPDGSWRISGEKHWISFGDHDASKRIGHCLLARTAGEKGLSLFLVPDRIDGLQNGVVVRRLEEKLGLHLSPTCALGFEEAEGVLLGEEGRGLAQMFVMITNMRMAVGAMGLGIASGSADVALGYARDRRQGGRGPKPVAIIEHADVQRQLLSMHARVELLRGLVYAGAAYADLGKFDPDADRRDTAEQMAQWLLPIIKTLGGETAFAVSSDAIQLLGGAGYTAEWPVEQALRDARVLPIFEGTTGMQALDLVHRRLVRDGGSGMALFLRVARAEAVGLDDDSREEANAVFDSLARAATTFLPGGDRADAVEAGATAFLDLAGIAALSWIAARLGCLQGDDPATERLRSLASFWLEGARARALASERAAHLKPETLRAIDVLRGTDA